VITNKDKLPGMHEVQKKEQQGKVESERTEDTDE